MVRLDILGKGNYWKVIPSSTISTKKFSFFAEKINDEGYSYWDNW